MGSIFGNSGQNTEFAQWYAKAKAEYEAKKAREKSETQRQRLQNQAEQGSDPNFIGPDPKWYADAVSGYKQDRQTAKLASETLSQGQGPRALQVKMPGSSLLQAAEQLTAKPQTVPNLLTQEGKAQADLELEQALERYREPELSQSYFSDALQDKRNRDDKLLRAAAYIPSKVWSGFSTAVNNAGWGTLYGVSDFINSYTHDPVTRKIADTANWFLQNQDTVNQQMDAYTDQYVPSAVNTYVGEALRGVGQSVPMLAEAYLTGGKSIADDLIKAGREAIPASLKLAGLSAGGAKYHDLREQGISPQQALSNAVTSGLSEMAIERMGYDELLPFFRNLAVGSSVKNAAKQALRSGAAEGLEEMTSDVTGNLIDKATYDPGKKWFGSGGVVDPASMAASGATGALSGLMLGGVGAVGSQISDVDPRLEVYRDTRLQQTQNRGTINPTEVARDGQGTQGTRYTAQTGESVSGINWNQANDSGRVNIDSRGEIEVRQNLGRSIRNSQSYTERNIQTQDGATQRYKEINTDIPLTPELETIAEDNARYGFSTAFVLDAMQEKGGVTKKQNGFYNNGTIYLDIESGHDLADVSRHELVHGGRDRNPDLFDDLYFSFYNNVDSNALQTAWEYYKQQYGANVSPEKLVEEFIADVAPLLDNTPTQEIFTDVDAVKQAYDVFFSALGTKVNQQESTQQAAEMDTGNGTDTRLEQQAGVQPDLQQAKETIAQYGDKTGRKVVWYNDQSQPEHAGANGYMKNGVLYINENAQNPYMEVFKHELFHSLPADAKQGVIDFFRTNVNEDTPAFREFKAQEMQRQRQRNLKYSDADFWEEYAAQNAEFLLDEGYIEKLAQTDRNLAQKILDAIKRLLEQVGDIFGAPKSYTEAVNTHEAAFVSGLNDVQLRKAQRLYEQALRQTNQTETGMRYSIETLPDGNRYVQADRQVIYSNDPDMWGQEITDYINQKIRNGEDVAIPTEDGDILKITGDTAWKLADRNDLSDWDYGVKMNMATHIDELARVSQFDRNKPDVNQKHAGKRFSPDSFDYRTAFFRDFDGSYYRLNLSIGVDENGKTVYSIGKNIQKRRFPKVDGSSSERGALLSQKPSATDSIPQNGETVNTSIRDDGNDDTRYSMKRSQFYDSLQEADTVDDKVKQGVAEQIDAFGYQPIANEQTMKKASEQISKDPEKRAVRFLGLDGKHATTDDVAEGFLLLKQYQDDGDYESAVEVAKKLAALGTEAGRNVQIYSVLERLTPEGMLKYATSELEKVKSALAKEKGKQWMDTYGKKLNLTAEEAKWITDTMTRVQAMPDGRDRAVLLGEIQKRIQQKIPSSVGEKIRALQRISLLLNPKTVISRNMLSNAIMNPFWTASDFIASGIDKAVGKATGMRTTGLPSYRQQARGMKKGAYESFDDFRRGINTRDAAADNFKIGKGSAFKGSNKLSKTLAALDRTTSFLLDIGDRPFFEGYFLESLNGQMKANNVTQPTADMIDIARQTALEKTWQDDNAITQSAQWLRDSMNKINKYFGLSTDFGLGSIITPFVKTPANIAKAIVEFSPVGFARGLVYDGNKLLRAVKNGTATPQMQRNFVNDVAKGMTGTIMYMIAGVLAANGLLTGSDDEKDKDVRNFKRNIQGIMQNSIKIGGKSYSYDWAQPIGGILTTMADIQNQTYSKDNMINTLTQAMTAGGNTLFEQSMLSGLSDFFGNYDGFMTSLVRAFVEAPSQFLPTLGKQIAEAIDPVARRTQGNGLLDTAGNRMLAKIPGATKKLEPVVDVLGRDVMRYGGKNSLFNIFLNPANVNIANPTPVTTEVWRLYEQTGDTTVFPRVAPSSFTDDGTKYEMTDKEQTQFQRTMGQEADRLIQKLMDSAKYQNADDAEKAELVADAVEESYDKAKKELIESRGGTPTKRLKKVGDSK